MIAEFNGDGRLPPGIHRADWEEFVERFGANVHRKGILQGLREAMDSLRTAGCKKVYINGSFVTSKQRPNDFDGCWETGGVDLERLDPVLRDFSNGRKAQKEKFSGEFFPVSVRERCSGLNMMDFFQKDKESGDSKGIVCLDLEGSS